MTTTATSNPKASAPRGKYPAAVVSAAAFLKRREPWLRREPRDRLLPYIAAFWYDGRIGIVRSGGRIVAVALARATNDLARTQAEPYYHDEAGRIVWLDHIASAHPQGIAVLLGQALMRFGRRDWYAGNVFKRAGELRMLPHELVERLTKTGGIPHGLPINSCTTRAA